MSARKPCAFVKQTAGGAPEMGGELEAVSGAVAAAEAEHAPTPVQLLASVTAGGAPAATLSASLFSLPVAGQEAAGGL